MDEVYSKQPFGSWIRAWTAERREAKFEEKILAVNLAESDSILEGIYTVRFAVVGVELSKTWEPRDPPREMERGKPLGRTLIGRLRASSNLMPL